MFGFVEQVFHSWRCYEIAEMKQSHVHACSPGTYLPSALMHAVWRYASVHFQPNFGNRRPRSRRHVGVDKLKYVRLHASTKCERFISHESARGFRDLLDVSH